MATQPNQWSKQANTSPSALAVIRDLRQLETFFTKLSDPPTTQQLQQFYKLMSQLNNNFAQGKFSIKTHKDAIAFQNVVMQFMANPNQGALIFLDNQLNLFIEDLMKC